MFVKSEQLHNELSLFRSVLGGMFRLKCWIVPLNVRSDQVGLPGVTLCPSEYNGPVQ